MEDILSIVFFFGTILATIGFFALRIFLKHQVEMFDRKLAAHGQLSDQTQGEIAALRQELAHLRDTSTQYDVSLQNSLEELQRRVAYMENKARPMRVLGTEEQVEKAHLARS